MKTNLDPSPSNTQSLKLARARLAEQIEGSARSALAVVPRILELLPQVGSVVDVGCGAGTWLHQFRLHGVSRVVGIDNVNPAAELLHIDKSEFLCQDLLSPLTVGKGFDLAISLGVAEHLPPELSENFVANLTGLSDAIVFSAAIPGQGGTNNANERWPSYWAALFGNHGFVCFDILRGSLWYDERIEWRYKQNMLIFVKRNRDDLIAGLKMKQENYKAPLDLVHPRCFEIYRIAALNAYSGQAGDMFQGSIGAGYMVERQLFTLRTRLLAIEQSTSWRAISFLQRIVAPYPGLRRFLRRTAKLGWWTLTLQLPGKILERVRARAKRR